MRTTQPSGSPLPADTLPRRHGWLPRGSEGLRYRAGVAVRAVAAIGGGYALSGLWSAAIALYLPASPGEAAVTATLVAFVIYPCAVMWVFAMRSAARAWLGLLIAAALPAAVLGWHYFLRSAT